VAPLCSHSYGHLLEQKAGCVKVTLGETQGWMEVGAWREKQLFFLLARTSEERDGTAIFYGAGRPTWNSYERARQVRWQMGNFWSVRGETGRELAGRGNLSGRV
jgi:hypothetical protein